MSPSRYWAAFLLLSASLVIAGCGKKEGAKAESEHPSEDGHEHQEGEKESGVTFKEGRGLQLSHQIVEALSLKTTEVEERAMRAETELLAQVFALRPEILASARVSEAVSRELDAKRPRDARIVRVDRAALSATRMVDVVFGLDRNPAPQIGDFVSVRLASEQENKVVVPTSAVLDSAAGTFVYVVNGEFYLRTPVKTGAISGDFVEITDGLYAGDKVVASAVDQLWLAELRLTKGGGHSH